MVTARMPATRSKSHASRRPTAGLPFRPQPKSTRHKISKNLQLQDRHQEAGLEFQYDNGDRGSQYLLVEAIGGGVAALDFDADGWPDLYFPQGCPMPVPARQDERDDCVQAIGWFQNVGGKFSRRSPTAAGLAKVTPLRTAGLKCRRRLRRRRVCRSGRGRNLGSGPTFLYHNNGDGTS